MYMKQIKLDLLAIVAHPDDLEIGAGGTALWALSQGYTVGIVDLTRGELGTRGSAEIRDHEAMAAAKMMGVTVRENLGLADGFFHNDKTTMMEIVKVIRKYSPGIILTNSPSDRHPDHGRASGLVSEASFYAGLKKIETEVSGIIQKEHRPKAVYHFIQDYYLKPDFVVDITSFWSKKVEVLKCFGSQFFDENSVEPETPISGKGFFDFLKARAMEMGRPSGFELAEGFIVDRPPGVKDLFQLQ